MTNFDLRARRLDRNRIKGWGLEEAIAPGFNCHRDHFSSTFGLATASDEIAHTACVAFGMDRLALALFATHGLDTARWPQQARESLGL